MGLTQLTGLSRQGGITRDSGITFSQGVSSSSEEGSGNLFFTDDAYANQFFTDNAKTIPFLYTAGTQPSIDGNFDDSVMEPFLSYVLAGKTSTPTVTLIPRRTTAGTFDPLPGHWGIYFARLNKMSGKTPTITVPTAGNYFGFLANNGWWSYDRTPGSWQPFANASPSGNNWVFSNNSAFTQDTVYVSFNPIFSGPEIKQWLADNESTGFIYQLPSAVSYGGQRHQIGATHLGYPIYAFRVSDDSQAPAGGGSKKRVVVFGGTHASEVCGSWNVKGMIDFILSSDPIAINLRKEFEFWVCAQTTPETRAKGKFRYTYEEDIDPNRRYPHQNTGGFTGPGHEAQIPVNSVESDWGATGPIDCAVDFHGGVFSLYGGYFFSNVASPGEQANGYALIAALEVYAGVGNIHDYEPSGGGYLVTTGAGWMQSVLGAKYSASAEMGTTAIDSIQDMTDFGVYMAKAFNYLYFP